MYMKLVMSLLLPHQKRERKTVVDHDDDNMEIEG
jgi:hypothetical protein